MDGRNAKQAERRGIRGRGLAKEICLMLAGFAVVWFALVAAAAHFFGPDRLCYASLPSELCQMALAGL